MHSIDFYYYVLFLSSDQFINKSPQYIYTELFK